MQTFYATIFLMFTAAAAVQQLQMVIQNSRHGARSPISLDKWNNWTHPGELTSNGIREEYVLGKEVKNRYASLIPPTFDPKQVYVQSTNYNRTIQSVYAQLYAIFTVGNEQNAPQLPPSYDPTLAYPPLSQQIQYPNFGNSALPNNYTPIPVHGSEIKYDHLLKGYQAQACPYQKKLYDMQKQSIILQKQDFIQEITPLIEEAVANNWIISKDSTSFDAMDQTAYLYDTMYADYTNRSSLPITYNSPSWKNHEYMFNVYHQYMENGNPLQYQLGSTIFLNNVLNTFVNKTKGLRTETYILYSSHDSNLVSLLSSFNVMNVSCFENKYKIPNYTNPGCVFPPYASSMFFELWADPQNLSNASVKVKYNDYTLPLCPWTLDGSCDLNSFAQVIQTATGGYSAYDYFQICNYGPPTPPQNNSSSLRPLLIIIAIGLIVAIGFVLKKEVIDPWKEQSADSQGNNGYVQYPGQ